MIYRLTSHEQEITGSCGPASLKIVLGHWGEERTERELRELTGCNKNGVGAEKLVEVARGFGYDAFFRDNCTWEDLKTEVRKYPVIVDWFSQTHGHYSVAIKTCRNKLVIADPEFGVTKEFKKDDFLQVWFDYYGDYPQKPEDFIVRRMIVVRKKEGLEGSLK